jgi:hypothetical protein
MILYVNGDSHAAAAESVVPHAWAEDDELYWGLGRKPHPENERVSFGCELANHLNAILECDAQAGGSNARIMRTTRQWLQAQPNVKDFFVVIQWSTWERQEWLHNNTWWQVNASGIDQVPNDLQQRYKEFVANINWKTVQQQAHTDIWKFYNELLDHGVRHVMFNGNNHFGNIVDQKDWGTSYMNPYLSEMTYDFVLRNKGFKTVNPDSWHFGPDAHCYWAEYVLQYIKDNQLLDPNEIPTY